MNVAPNSLPRRVMLRNGRVVDVRRLEPADREWLAAGVRRLSPETRFLRFAGPKPHLTKRELDFLVDIDHHTHEAILAVDPASGRGIAVVRYVEVPGEPGVVEIAATVADDWQGHGLGPALLAQLAHEEGHSTLRASVLATNRRSIAMLLRAGFAPLKTQGTIREYQRLLTSSDADWGRGGDVARYGRGDVAARSRPCSRRAATCRVLRPCP